MGVGIVGILPLKHKIEDKKYFHDDYLDAFELQEETGFYQLKPALLFDHFKDFLIGFDCIIENKRKLWLASKWDELDGFVQSRDYEGYLRYLEENSNRSVPFYEDSNMVSVLAMEVDECIVFYDGSYKADLEEYSTLSHMEKLLAKAFNNPLAKIAKFCIYG